MDKLKPCPFCGGKVSRVIGIMGLNFFRCKGCGAVVSFDNDYYNTHTGEAVEAWNNRVEQPRLEFGGIPIDHLRELVRAEEDGRLLVLPCKAGDTVYKIFCNEIIPAIIEKVEINAFTNPKIWVQIGTDFTLSQEYRFDLSCGKDFYLTCEDAEAALEAQKGEVQG